MKILNQLIIGAGLLATASPVLATGKRKRLANARTSSLYFPTTIARRRGDIWRNPADYVKKREYPPPGSGRMRARQLFLYELDLRTQPCCDHDRRL